MKKNKLTYALIFALTFIGFIGGVNASCCYQTADGKYVYNASMPDNICSKQNNFSTSLNETACNAKNGQVCCDKATGTVANGLTDSECATKGYKKVDYGTCTKTINEQITACDNISAEDCSKNLHGTYNANTGCCTYSSSTDIDTSSNNAAYNTEQGCCWKNGNVVEWHQGKTCSSITGSGYGIGSTTQSECNNQSLSSTGQTANIIGNQGNTTSQERTGRDTDWGTGSKPTDSTIDMQIDLGCEGMKEVLGLIKIIYNLIRYATPIVLIILGSIDMLRAVMAGKEDDIKKNQKRFVSRLVLAVGIFLLLSVFELITNILDRSNVSDSKAWYNCWTSLMIMFK